MANPTIQAQTYNSYSGVDITPIFQGVPIGEIQAISYSINREKAPIYTMGSANPRSFSRGKRGIAGSLIFIVFDTNALLDQMVARGALFAADTTEVGIVPNRATLAASAQPPQNSTLTDANFGKEVEAPWYTDQIPPFDIVLAAANEYGAMASMAIYGAEILNENSGVSIDDIVTEQQFTYIARQLTAWQINTENSVTGNVGFIQSGS